MADYNNFEDWLSKSFIKSKYGLLKPNRFIIDIQLPNLLMNSFKKRRQGSDVDNQGEFLVFNAMAVQCPNISIDIGSLSLNSWQINYYKERIDADLSITFLETPDLTVRRFFSEWMRLGFDPVTKARNYIDDVISSMVKVYPLLPDGSKDTFDFFTDVLPYDISDINYDLGMENAITKTEVKFKYVIHDMSGNGESLNFNSK